MDAGPIVAVGPVLLNIVGWFFYPQVVRSGRTKAPVGKEDRSFPGVADTLFEPLLARTFLTLPFIPCQLKALQKVHVINGQPMLVCSLHQQAQVAG